MMRRSAARALASSGSASKPWASLPSATTATTSRWFAAVPEDSEGAGEEAPPVAVAEAVPPPTLSELKNNLRPSEIVEALDKHIVGQQDAKKAVAIAMRNRWRRRQLPEELRKEVTPRNVLLVGPTGKLVAGVRRGKR